MGNLGNLTFWRVGHISIIKIIEHLPKQQNEKTRKCMTHKVEKKY